MIIPKTLKDIDLNIDEIHDWHRPSAIEALKSEAIKWVKELKEKYDSGKFESTNIGGLNFYWEPYEANDYEPTISFIKHFFNLTEEDLI